MITLTIPAALMISTGILVAGMIAGVLLFLKFFK